jgi:sulfoxide reductase heme-binding subunit YedZ
MRRLRTFKAVLFVLAALPAVVLAVDAFRGNLTADPIEEITHRTGWWTITLLMVTLSVTPIRRFTGWHQLVKVRRMLGLFAFFYASLHLLTYVVLDLFFAFDILVEDVAKRPYITVGFAGFLMLLALALTSTKGWIRRLGKRWQQLHRLVYVAALLGVVHFYWQVKADTREPLIYAGILLALLVARLRFRVRTHDRARMPATDAPEAAA